MEQELPAKIGQFFLEKENELLEHCEEDESQLLSSLQFATQLALFQDKPSERALFGWGSLKADFRPNDDESTIIEVKYIRTTKLANGSLQHNECDIKNSLSQIIEQAACKNKGHAILVVIDAGRYSTKPWGPLEEKFISMFKQNPFSIDLSVVRIKLDIGGRKVSYSIF